MHKNINCIKGLTIEEIEIAEQLLYDIVVEGKPSSILKDFLFEKLKLKYKKDAMIIVRNQLNKTYKQLHRIELLQLGTIKAKWCYLGEYHCQIEKHKFYNNIVFNLETGLWDDELNRYIFPSELENCNCDFLSINNIED